MQILALGRYAATLRPKGVIEKPSNHCYVTYTRCPREGVKMGTWGTAIFSDDIATDVRDVFTDMIGEGLSTTAATKCLLTEYEEELDDPDDGNVVWLALAATQHKLGRLTTKVKNKAIRIIDSGADIARWEACTKSEINQRKKHLAKLRLQLTADQPAPKKVRRPKKSSTNFNVGDVFAYQVTSRTTVRFCVLNIWSDLGGTYANICLLSLDDGKPFRKKRLVLNDTLGPHYTMVSREPDDRISMLSRGVALPDRVPKTFRAWNNLKIRGHACDWDEFPDVLRKVLRKLGWKKSK